MRGMQPDWPHYRSPLAAKAMVKSDVVKDCTRRLQAAVDEINLGNLKSKSRNVGVLSPNEGCEEGNVKAKRKDCDSELCVHENNTDSQVSILQLLDTGQSSVGAQQQSIREEDGEKRECIMNSSLPQSSVLTARAVDIGGIFTPMPPTERVDNCFAVCNEVIKRRDHHQTTARCTSCAEQCSSVQRLQLYPCRQRIRLQLSSIIEQNEGDDSTAISSFKASQQKNSITPFSCFVISSHSSAESGNVADMSADASDCSALPCILVQEQKVEQRRIVSDVPADFPWVKQLGNVTTISGRDKLELDGYNSYDDRGDFEKVRGEGVEDNV